MPKKDITLTIDGIQVTVPEGTVIVDAAKKVGIDVPVFCYHPKMEPVGMCRMCLVEIGRPVRDRATGELVLEEGQNGVLQPKLQFGPKLETACTTPVSEGMVVLGTTDKVREGRKDIIEFLLTSHPLDCPTCDKGGECPLQNLTMGYGPGTSRYLLDEKMRLAKHYPLSELIVLDRERCIQCGRCVRFQDEVVDDPVIGFFQRGRSLQIVSFSDPGFDSYYSGNTTDICPVGALISTDWRFRARPWEINQSASICTQCPVGCNTTLNTRREAAAGGEWTIKRVMPRQNEQVNEIWICDKGRYGYHYAQVGKNYADRLDTPLVRKNGQLTPVSWEEALQAAADGLKAAGSDVLTLAGGRLSNEDLFNLAQFAQGVKGQAGLYTTMAGGDLTARYGLAPGTNFGSMGPETAILVVACDLEEEAPIWWLRVKQAAGALGGTPRGAQVIVMNARDTKMDRAAAHKIRYPYGAEAGMVLAFVNALSAGRPDLPEAVKTISSSPEIQAAAQVFAKAENAVIIYGSDGTGLEASQALAQACANLLLLTNHVGRPNNGLLGVWSRANDQGAWDMGLRPLADLPGALQAAKAVYLAAVDPLGDDPNLARPGGFMVVQELFLTETARQADVVLPAQAFTQREGTFTNGERRVQRFYPGVPEPKGALPDFAITGRLGQLLGLDLESRLPSLVFQRLAATVPSYKGITYQKLAEVEEQWPIIGRADLYYGGTSYDNHQGLGVQLPPAAYTPGANPKLSWLQPPQWNFPEKLVSLGQLVAVPVTRLYDRGNTLLPSKILEQRIPRPYVVLSPADATRTGLAVSPDGELQGEAYVQIDLNAQTQVVQARVDASLPAGMVLVPRSLGIPISNPTTIDVKIAERVAAV